MHGRKMELNLTSREMEILLNLTANNSHLSSDSDSLWRKVSAQFVLTYNAVKDSEKVGA